MCVLFRPITRIQIRRTIASMIFSPFFFCSLLFFFFFFLYRGTTLFVSRATRSKNDETAPDKPEYKFSPQRAPLYFKSGRVRGEHDLDTPAVSARLNKKIQTALTSISLKMWVSAFYTHRPSNRARSSNFSKRNFRESCYGWQCCFRETTSFFILQ